MSAMAAIYVTAGLFRADCSIVTSSVVEQTFSYDISHPESEFRPLCLPASLYTTPLILRVQFKPCNSTSWFL